MADWMDWLEGISGGSRGVVEGLTLGMKPFDAWESVRTKDLENDKRDVLLEDLYGIQGARNAMPNYYPDVVGAANAGSRRTMAQADSDIFGLNRALNMQQFVSDPTGAFQSRLRETGLTPGDPEYRQLLADAMGEFDPFGAVGAYDKFGVPAMQTRNLNEQTALTFIENWVQQKDAGARVVRLDSGEVVVIGSDGEMTPLPGDVMMKVSAMLSAKSPYDALSTGIKDEIGITNANANLWKAMQTGQISPAAAITLIDKERVAANQAYSQIMALRNQITKGQDYMLADEATKATMTAALDAQLDQVRKRIAESDNMRNRVLSTGTTRGVAPGMPSNLLQGAGIAPQGSSSVTTRRPPPSAIGSRAAGGAALPDPMGPPSNLAPIPAGRGRSGYPRGSQGTIGGAPYVAPNVYGENDALQEFIAALLMGQENA